MNITGYNGNCSICLHGVSRGPLQTLPAPCCSGGCLQCICLQVQSCVCWQGMQKGSGSKAYPEYHPWIPTYSLHNAVLKPEGADLPVQAVHKLVKTCR